MMINRIAICRGISVLFAYRPRIWTSPIRNDDLTFPIRSFETIGKLSSTQLPVGSAINFPARIISLSDNQITTGLARPWYIESSLDGGDPLLSELTFY